MIQTAVQAKESKGTINALQKQDMPIHGWYRFVLSFPPHLVRQYLSAFEVGPDSVILDPFCGTGTTMVEAKKRRIASIGCDAHPLAVLASRVKTNWRLHANNTGRIGSSTLGERQDVVARSQAIAPTIQHAKRLRQ